MIAKKQAVRETGAGSAISLSNDIVDRMGDVKLNLALQTLAVARSYPSGDLNGRQWSNEQRDWLHTNGFPGVTVNEEETSYWQTLANNLLGCATDPVCIGNWTRGPETPAEMPYGLGSWN